MRKPLEQSNEKITRIDLWKRAKELADLHNLVNSDIPKSVSRVYDTLTEFERRADVRESDAVLHSKAEQDT